MAAMEIDTEKNLQRKKSTYQSLDETFEIQNETYRGQQYSQIYFARLHMMTTLLYSLVTHWKPHVPGHFLDGHWLIVHGVDKFPGWFIFQVSSFPAFRSALPLVKPHNFMHPDDHLDLEDESGRDKLGGTVLSPSVYVTGVVVALHGKETGAGDFMVLDVLEAGLAPQIEPQLKSREDKYVVFISGVNAGCSLSNPLQFQLLVDHITGHLGDEKEQGIAAEIVHVVIAGNSVEIPLGLLNGQNLASKDQSRLSEPVQELDILLTQIAAGVPMDIMPGSNDPANFSLPQQSLNRWLFPGSIAYNTFRSCTDPHCFELDGVRILGTSGQNIDDLKKYSEGKDELEFMERTLKWRHVAPTTPNTLGCYPFTDRDPFLIENCPHVYFVGNQDKYGTHILKGSEGQLVKLISIPKFCNTGMVAVLNLRNLECHTLSFGTQFSL
uniref:DNA polymerase delta small subunit-like isoform X1 n=1 Tax=Populus alba TaxID=43335 RepID=A0A4U5NKY9_POPAL|nr:DNA polymerase delta small subunit-like isoform X1 [Populus alba]